MLCLLKLAYGKVSRKACKLSILHVNKCNVSCTYTRELYKITIRNFRLPVENKSQRAWK